MKLILAENRRNPVRRVVKSPSLNMACPILMRQRSL